MGEVAAFAGNSLSPEVWDVLLSQQTQRRTADLGWPVFKLQLETFTQKCGLNHLRSGSCSASFLKFLSRMVGNESRGKKARGKALPGT